MRAGLQNRNRARRGSAMVELAITLLAFLFLVFGIMDFGMAVYAQTFCYSAAQDAARWVSVHGALSASPASSDDVTAHVKSQAIGLDPSLINVLTCWGADTSTAQQGTSSCSSGSTTASGNNTSGSNVIVTVKYTVNPLSGVALKKSLTIQSSSSTVINH